MKSFCDVTSVFPKGMPVMLKQLSNFSKLFYIKLQPVDLILISLLTTKDLSLDGRHHSGIDDCKNIAKIARELANRGHVYKENGRLINNQ